MKFYLDIDFSLVVIFGFGELMVPQLVRALSCIERSWVQIPARLFVYTFLLFTIFHNNFNFFKSIFWFVYRITPFFQKEHWSIILKLFFLYVPVLIVLNLKILFTRRNKEVVLCLVQIDIHTYIQCLRILAYANI